MTSTLPTYIGVIVDLLALGPPFGCSASPQIANTLDTWIWGFVWLNRSSMPVPQNPEVTVEVMKLASQERVQQRTVERIMDVPVTMHVEAAQADEVPQSQFLDRVDGAPVSLQRQTIKIQKVKKTVGSPQVQFIDELVGVPVHGRDRSLADHGSKRQLHTSQQQQQHQAVHKEKEAEKEESKKKGKRRKEKEREGRTKREERARARRAQERRRKRERRGRVSNATLFCGTT